MKEQLINNIYCNLPFTPLKGMIFENLDDISQNKLITEINKLVPLIDDAFEYTTNLINTNLEKLSNLPNINNEYMIKFFQKEREVCNNFLNNKLKNQTQLIENYQYLFNQMAWLGHYLIRTKNELIYSKQKLKIREVLDDIEGALQKLNNIIDVADHKTPLETKEAINISDDNLPYIKLINLLWLIDDYMNNVRRLISEDKKKEFISYYYEVKGQIKKWRQECMYNLSTEETKKKDEKEKREKLEKQEKQMDNYMLEDWQKELVRKGEYDPWSFEEDGELEEGDFYYEDDK